MGSNYKHYPHEQSGKIRATRITLKIIAIILIILSIVLIIWGLLPHEKIVQNSDLGGPVACFQGIEAEKGDILVIDYVIEGIDVNFYLTYDRCWQEGNVDPIVEKEHARNDHFEVEITKSGNYYMNFEKSGSSNQGTFDVDLNYKIMDKYSPLHIALGVVCLVVAFILIIISVKLKHYPHVRL
jgi:hypothetical protein